MLKVLEKDIYWLSKQHHIAGFDQEDIQQELRLTVWVYGYNYNPYLASINTWGKILLKGKLKKLYRDHCTTDRRKINTRIESLEEMIEGNRLYGINEDTEENQNPNSNPGIS